MARKLLYKKTPKTGLRPTIFPKKNRKGLSAIVTTLILVALSMGAMVLIWTVINKMIQRQTGHTEACFGNYEKVTLNALYTCYTEIGIDNYEVRFSLKIGDISNVEKVIVGLSSASAVKSYQITNTEQLLEGLAPYPAGTGNVKLPEPNAGLSYVTSMTSKPDLINIQPVINGETCEMSDSLSEIENCNLIS